MTPNQSARLRMVDLRNQPQFYTYFRSSASYRVRIALELKGLTYEAHAVHLLDNGGEQFSSEYRALNPQCLVPTYLDNAGPLTQSLAIIEYLDELYPQPPLFPDDPYGRAKVRAMASLIASDVHPLNNLRVIKYLRDELSCNEISINRWYRHWISEGLSALNTLIGHEPCGRFCFGDRITLADICLIPQLANARRYDCDLAPFPRLAEIDALCRENPAFAPAAP